MAEHNLAKVSDLTFVIPTYNRLPLLKEEASRIRCLAERAHVLIVDDGSEDGSESFIRDEFKGTERIRVLRTRTNMGSAHSWNTGLSNAMTSLVFFLHDDSIELVPDPDQFIRQIEADLARYQIVGVHVVEWERFVFGATGTARDVLYMLLYAFAGQVISRNYGKTKQTWFVPGILGVRADVGLKVRYDEVMLAGYGFREESDFQLRARRKGCKILYDGGIGVVHKTRRGGGQTKNVVGKRYPFWAIRNQMIFMRKNRLRLWPPRFAIFVLYQAALHGATPNVIRDSVREAVRVLARAKAAQ